ncbi:hypothetical protein ACFOW4_16655 [Micromonospora sp. GCM10011542]|uniref:hypothetical protein n=1 Tax=Micromonospora sp. GCM10011542 TaxID=3317337 RepID=UPI0036080B72
MARRGWGVSIATAVGVAAGAGAAQLGFGYGLGVITWTPTGAGAAGTTWADGLTWATWLAASSTVLGAVCAQRLHQRPPAPAGSGRRVTEPTREPEPVREPVLGPPETDRRADDETATPDGVGSTDRGGALRRLALALGAGLGGLVTVLLVAVPARVAVGADTGAPQRVAAAYAALGVLVGVLVALWALRSRAAATNVIGTAAWLWLLAVVSVVDGVRVGRGLTGAALGTWQLSPDRPGFWIGERLYWPGLLLALVPALVIGALAARRTARSTGHRVGAAASGAAGPLLVALAYLLAVPRWTALGPEQVSAQLIAPYAVIAGVAGSVLAAALAERADRNRSGARALATPADPAPAERPEPTDTAPEHAGRSEPTPVATVDAEPEPAAPVDAVRVPRVPAPRTDPDRTDPVGADGAGPAEGPASGGRRGRSPRQAGRPTTD